MVFDGQAWNSCTVPLIDAAKAHCACAMLNNFADVLQGLQGLEAAEVAVMLRLGVLWALHTMHSHLGQFLEAGSVPIEQVQTVLRGPGAA
jgi:Acyl-CoA oxidase